MLNNECLESIPASNSAQIPFAGHLHVQAFLVSQDDLEFFRTYNQQPIDGIQSLLISILVGLITAVATTDVNPFMLGALTVSASGVAVAIGFRCIAVRKKKIAWEAKLEKIRNNQALPKNTFDALQSKKVD